MRPSSTLGLAFAQVLCLGLAGCGGETEFPEPPLEVQVDDLARGSFANGKPFVVHGRVNLPQAEVRVDGRAVNVGSDGSFSVRLPDDRPARNIDVQAYYREQAVRVRTPVFGGWDPARVDPGGATLRLTQRGLDGIGGLLGEQIDALGFAETLLALVPTADLGTLRIAPGLVRYQPTEVQLTPSESGVAVDIVIRDLLVRIDAVLVLNGEEIDLPIDVRFGEVRIGATGALSVAPDGTLTLSAQGAAVSTDQPQLELGPLDTGLLDSLLGLIADLIAGAGGAILDAVVGAIGDVPLLKLPSLSSDVLGFPIDVQLQQVSQDVDGVTLALGLNPEGAPVRMGPAPLETGLPRADMLLAVPDAVLQPLLNSDLLDLLDQDLALPGFLGGVLTAPLSGLPGGGVLPEAGAWCVAINPGEARLARLVPGTERLASVYLPELGVAFRYAPLNSSECTQTWLDVTLTARADLALDGSEIGIALSVPDGVVNAYGSPAVVDERELVLGLGNTLNTLVGLLGGSLGLDLGDLLGGAAVGGLDLSGLRVIGVTPAQRENGELIESVNVVSVQLFE